MAGWILLAKLPEYLYNAVDVAFVVGLEESTGARQEEQQMSKRTFLIVASLLCGLALASAGASAETIWYVKADAGGQNNGQSWEDAFTELQSALAVAESSDEVWVAAGVYLPDYDVNSGEHTLDREGTFQLMNGVEIYGGFVGGETRRDQRNPDPNTNGTVLSGDLLGDDGPNFENNDENSIHVTTGSGTDENAVLDGFTVKAGNADKYPNDDEGAGMDNVRGSPTLTNCTFSGNSAKRDGGGMSNDNNANPTLTDCTFSNNSAMQGGGMYNATSSPTLTNCTFTGNWARYGGGMCNWEDSHPTLTNCTFAANKGAAVECNSHHNRNTVKIKNCILWNGGNEIWNNDGSTITVTYSDVQGRWPGEGNIDADPFFVAGPLGCHYLSHEAAGQPQDSPCIDAGNPNSPMIDGTTRRDEVPDTDIVDMGYHYPITGVGHVPGDSDADGDVDMLDFARLQACFTGPGPASPARGCCFFDFEPDGDIDLNDYAVFHAALTGPK